MNFDYASILPAENERNAALEVFKAKVDSSERTFAGS